jgi:hypothetical protein
MALIAGHYQRMIMTETNSTQSDWEFKARGGSVFADGSAILKPDELDWVPGPLEGLEFKVTFADPNDGDWLGLVRLGADAIFPAHINHADVHYLIISGSLNTEHGMLKSGDYMRDPGGFQPERRAGAEGVSIFCRFQGGISAVDSDGNRAGPYIDALHVRELFAQHGMAETLYIPTR